MSRAFRAAPVVVALGWLVVPLLPVLVWAGAERWAFPDPLPRVWGLSGWRDAASAGLPFALLRSAALGLAVAAVATPLGVMAGWALGWRLTGHPRLVVALLLLPAILPPLTVAMGLDVALIRLGLPEPVSVVLLLAVVAVPYTSYTSATGFARTSPQLEAQARALGATARQARVRVVLPAMRHSIVVAALLAFLVGWSDYVVTLLVGGGRYITAPVLLGSAAAGSGNDAAVAAMAVATLVPPVLMVSALVGLRRRARAPTPSPASAAVGPRARTRTRR